MKISIAFVMVLYTMVLVLNQSNLVMFLVFWSIFSRYISFIYWIISYGNDDEGEERWTTAEICRFRPYRFFFLLPMFLRD